MEITESIGWIALGFLPMFGSMEVACRLGKRKYYKASSTKEATMKKKVSI